MGQMAGDERYDLWRKQGFICRPHTGEISDGTRFTLEYMEQVQKHADSFSETYADSFPETPETIQSFNPYSTCTPHTPVTRGI